MPDFLTEIANALRDKSEKILLVGGFAVNHHGYTRNTLDLDVMIASDQIAPLRQYLMNTGFTNIQDGPVALHFQHATSGTRIDVLPVDPQTFVALMANAEICHLSSDLDLKTPALKDLLALKIHAIHQNPSRRIDKDLPDIVWLSVLNAVDPESVLRPLCEKYADLTLYEQITHRIKSI